MRRGRRYCDAGTADLDSSSPVMNREPHSGPPSVGFRRDALKGSERQRLVRLIFEVRNNATEIVVANQAEEGCHGPIRPGCRAPIGHRNYEAIDCQWLVANGQ